MAKSTPADDGTSTSPAMPPPKGAPANAGALGPMDNPEVHAAIASFNEQMDELDAQAGKINAQRRALREGLQARGLNMDAVRAARAHHKANEKKRAKFDVSYLIARKALDLPVQADMLDEAPKAAGTTH